MALGEYPTVSLSAVRKKAHDLRGLVAAGVDPVALRREEEEQRNHETRTFRGVTDEWYTTVKGRYRPAYQRKTEWILRVVLCAYSGAKWPPFR